MSTLHPIEGIFVQCDPVTMVYVVKENESRIGNQKFVISTLGDSSLFIKAGKEADMRQLIDTWIDNNNTSKKDDEKTVKRRLQK